MKLKEIQTAYANQTEKSVISQTWVDRIAESPVGVFLKDVNGNFQYANQAFRDLVGPEFSKPIDGKNSRAVLGAASASACWYHDELAKLKGYAVSLLLDGYHAGVPHLQATKLAIPQGCRHLILCLVSPSKAVGDLDQVEPPAEHLELLGDFQHEPPGATSSNGRYNHHEEWQFFIPEQVLQRLIQKRESASPNTTPSPVRSSEWIESDLAKPRLLGIPSKANMSRVSFREVYPPWALSINTRTQPDQAAWGQEFPAPVLVSA